MMHRFVLLFCALALATTAHAAVQLTTKEGPVRGFETATGHLFPNIPYAAPPVGALRWKAPRLPLVRKTLWDGSKIDVRCAQVGAYFSGTTDDSQLGKPFGSEDCLYLNAWVPRAADAKKRPVLVWFHGGSNRQGYASDDLYNGEILAQKTDSIVVTVNYRLGYFGALYHEALRTNDRSDSSGNYVTLDALRALKWIRENVGFMGGDVDRITLAGESAGCVNVWGLMQSKLAGGLFAQAYCASGIPNSFPVTLAKRASTDMLEQALVLKGRAHDSKNAARVLAKMSNEQIRAFLYSLSTADVLSIVPSFFPTQHIADGHVLPIEGLAALNYGNYNKVPLILTTTGDEGSYFYLKTYSDLSWLDFWRVITGRQAPTALQNLIASDEYDEFKSKSDKYTYGFDQLNDSIMVPGQWVLPKVYRLRWNWLPTREPWRSTLMASHGIDLPLIFQRTDLGSRHFFSFVNPDLKTQATRDISNRFLRYLKGYLHSGDPNAFLPKDEQRWHQWYGAIPNNLVITKDEIDEELHFFNPIVGTYALTSSILELYENRPDDAMADH